MTNITDDQILELEKQAYADGDYEIVTTCRIARKAPNHGGYPEDFHAAERACCADLYARYAEIKALEL